MRFQEKTHKSRRLLAVPRFNLQGLVEQIICKLFLWYLPHGIEIFKEFLNETNINIIKKIEKILMKYSQFSDTKSYFSPLLVSLFCGSLLATRTALFCFDNHYSCKIRRLFCIFPLSNPRGVSWLLTLISGSIRKQ